MGAVNTVSASRIPIGQYCGRRVLRTHEEVITADNLIKVMSKVLPDYEANKRESDYLYWYWRGVQPILDREKKVRPEICNKIVENHANEIVSFKKGYTFADPVQYVRRVVRGRSEAEEDARETAVLELCEMMSSEDKQSLDEELAEWFFITGTSYRMALPKEDPDGELAPFEMDVLDPRYTGVVYHTGFGRRPLMCFQEILVGDDEVHRFCIYTEDTYYEVEGDVIVKQEPHALHALPICEYPANQARLGAFELVLPLLDAINTAASNRLDGVEQFIQSFMKFVNVRIDRETYRQLREEGALCYTSEPGNPAEVGMVTSELNQTQTQVLVEHLYQMVLIICGMPDRQGSNRTTGDSGQAVMLRDGWAAAESKAKETESSFKRADRKFLRYILSLCGGRLQISASDVDIKFPRNKTDNLLTKTQGLLNMLEAGVEPSLAFALCSLFSDPEQAAKDSAPYLEKWLEKDAPVRLNSPITE